MKAMFLSIFITTIFAVDYTEEIQPIFDNNCGNCHLDNSSGGLNLSSYDDLMLNDVIIPGNHASSELYDRITRPEGVPGNMPPQGSLSQEEIDLIALWIDEGALEQEPVMVTFNVNMSQEDITPGEGPTLWMGAFYPDPGFIMTDEDGDGVWSYTIALDPGTYTYKFRNGHWPYWNTGSGWEDLLGQDCAVGQWADREITVFEDTVVESVCFGSCSEECIESVFSNVTFQVDMSQEVQQGLSNDETVYVNGTFNGWCGACNPMSDVNEDGIWELTLEIPIGEYEYLFTTNGWDGLQGGAPVGSSCDWLPDDQFGNYGFVLEEGQDLMIGPYCFGTCWDTGCQPPTPVDVTFHIDMNNEDVIEDVYMIGNFQTLPWQTVLLPTQMEDLDGDGIYSATINVLSDDIIEYKFVNGSEIESDEGIGACGNNPESNCDSPGNDCNNREFQVPSCELNDNGDCVLEPLDASIVTFNSCSAGEGGTYQVTFDIDGLDECGFVSITGSFSNWDGWGATNDNNWTISLEEGDYEFTILCVDTSGEWWNDIWSASTQYQAPAGSDCDFDPNDEYPNYGFTVNGENLTVAYCAGSCEETCDETSETHQVTFDIDGVDDCEFVSVTGSFDNWSGWGAHTDNGMQASLQDGDYEFVILCANGDGWWYDIWASSTILQPTLGSDCDFDTSDEYPNYGFTVGGEDLTVAYCAGSCEETCGDSTDACDDVICDEGSVCEDGFCVDEITQIDLPVDFEGSTINYTMTDFGGNVSSLVTDPYDANNMAIEVIKTNGAETWAGTTIGTPAGFATNIPLTLSNSVMAVRVWSPQVGTPIRLKVEDSNDPTHTCETETNTTISGWQILEFDFTNQAPGTESLSAGLDYGWTYNMASIFFNFGMEGMGETYYFDDVQICDGVCEDDTCIANGDVSGDDILNVVDVVAIVGYILGNSTDLDICAADINEDGIVNVVDVVAIVGIILGG